MARTPKTAPPSNGSKDTVPSSPRAAGRLPSDPEAFVAGVERATNEYDTDVIRGIFATDGVSEIITDGGRDVNRGVDQIAASWAADCAAFRARRLKLTKRLIAATDDTIVNEWRGGFGGRGGACGIEVWKFDSEGKVIDQRLYSYLRVRPSMSATQGLRSLLTYPVLALTFGRERLRKR